MVSEATDHSVSLRFATKSSIDPSLAPGPSCGHGGLGRARFIVRLLVSTPPPAGEWAAPVHEYKYVVRVLYSGRGDVHKRKSNTVLMLLLLWPVSACARRQFSS